MLKMPVDARKATEATGGVLDSTSKRVKEHDAAGMGRFGIVVDCWEERGQSKKTTMGLADSKEKITLNYHEL